MPTELVDTGFVVGRDSFSFPNFGGNASDSRVTAVELVRMFGAEEVCNETTEDGTCRLTRVAKAWLDRINTSMSGGRCEGFAVLSSLMHLGIIDTEVFGGKSAAEIEFDKPVKREIAYWFATQYFPATVNNTKPLTAVQAVSFLTAEYEKPKAERDLWRIGMTRLDERGAPAGGHALTAFAVAPDPAVAGRYLISVYDNNHPDDAARAIVVDEKLNRWEYRAATNPEQPDALYVGTAENRNRLFISPVRARVGKQPCRFCRSTDVNEDAPLSQVFGSAPAEVAVTDASGRSSGVLNGVMVSDIPDSTVTPTFSETGLWTDDAPPQLFVPAGLDLDITIQGRGGSANFQDAAVGILEPGRSLVVEQLRLGGQRDALTVGAGLEKLRYESNSGTALAITMVQTLPSGGEVEAGFALPEGAASVTTEVDAETGNVEVGAVSTDGTSVEIQLDVTRASSEGEESFEGAVTVPSGGAAAMDVENWAGEGEPLSAAIDEDGDGTPDVTVVVDDTGPVGEPPEAPAAFTASLVAGGPSVQLAWTDVANSEESYEIERAEDGGAFVALATTAASVDTYVDATTVHERVYAYQVRAVNPSGASAWVSAEVSVPAPSPSALAASAVTALNVTLTWTDEALLETAYVIERALDATPLVFQTLARLPPDAGRYEDTAVAPDTAYVYRVGTEGPGGAASATLAVRTPVRPEPPTAFTAQSGGRFNVPLTWTDTQVGLTGYEIERATGTGGMIALVTVPADTFAYNDASTSAETDYTYRIRGVNLVENSVWSAEAHATTAPPAPSELRVSSTTATRVELAWTDNALRESAYLVERSSDGGVVYLPLATLPPDSGSFADSAASSSTDYVYRLVVVGPGGTNNASVTVTTPSLPPGTFTALAASPTSVELTWTDVQAGITSYDVERATEAGSFAPLTVAPGGQRSFTDTTPTSETAFRYRIRSNNAVGNSDWSADALVTTPPPAPTIPAIGPSTGSDCTSLYAGGQTSDGLYTIDPDGDGPSPAFETWCDMSNGGWTLLNDQDVAVAGGFLPEATWLAGVGTTAPNGGQWGTLDKTPLFRSAAGDFEFRLTYGQTQTEYIQWRQTGDPLAGNRGTLSEVVSVPGNQVGCGAFSGVAADASLESAMDGDSACWWFAIGSVAEGLPAYNGSDAGSLSTDRMRFWVRRQAPLMTTATTSSVTLAWVDNAQQETGYRVERSNDGGTTYVPLASLPADAASYVDTTVSPDTTYSYRVIAVGAGGESSADQTVTTPPRPLTPTAFTAQAAGATSVLLAWTDAQAGVVAYEIERATGAGSFIAIASVPVGQSSFADAPVAAETEYRYRVRTVNAVGDSEWSTDAIVTTPPPAPTGSVSANRDCTALYASGSTSDGLYMIDPDEAGPLPAFQTWCDMTNGGWTMLNDQDVGVAGTFLPAATWLAGVRNTAPNAGQWGALNTLPHFRNESGDFEFRMTYGQSQAEYLQWFQTGDPLAGERGTLSNVVGVPANQAGCSPFGGVASEGTQSALDGDPGGCWWFAIGAAGQHGIGIPTYERSTAGSNTTTRLRFWARTQFVVTTTATATSVALQWKDNALLETGYLVERSTDGGLSFLPIASLAADAEAFNDTTVSPDTAYTYRVTAVGAGGEASVILNVTTPPLPLAPTAFTAQSSATPSVALAWTDAQVGILEYALERAAGQGAFAALTTVAAGQASFTDSTVTPETTYAYRIAARNVAGQSAWSTEAVVVTHPPAPAGLRLASATNLAVSLAWNDVSTTETAYRVERAPATASTSFALVTTVAADATDAADSSVVGGTDYVYRVTTVSPSGEVSATLPVSVPFCATGETRCDTTCVDLQADPTHCGSCTTTCASQNAGALCVAGSCDYDACTSGFLDCDSDRANGCEANGSSLTSCGTCGETCSGVLNATAACTAESCGYTGLCAPGFDDCDGDASNGCETNVQTDVANCGACNTTCSAGLACVAEACVLRTNGDGSDGALTVSGTTDINTVVTLMASSVTAGATVFGVQSSAGFAVGKTIMIHQSQGTGAGTWELAAIAAVDGATMTSSLPLQHSYSGAQITLVPQYTNVTVQSGATLTAPAWNGSTGGILAFQATGNVTVEGTVSMAGRGYRGALKPGVIESSGQQGEGHVGAGSVSYLANGSGGGGGRYDVGLACDGSFAPGGGGGSLGTPGTAGTVDSCHQVGDPGDIVGVTTLQTFLFGGAGGAGGADDEGLGGNGGNGGGLVLIQASALTVTGVVDAGGATGGLEDNATGCGSGGGGGGAGGSIRLELSTGTLGSNLVTAVGGAGGDDPVNCGYAGGAGGAGRIDVTGLVTGTTTPDRYLAASCRAAYDYGMRGNGSYVVDPLQNDVTTTVYCDMDNGGFTYGASDATMIAAGYYQVSYGDGANLVPICPISSAKVYPIAASQGDNCPSNGVYVWTAGDLACMVDRYEAETTSPSTIALAYFGDGVCVNVGDRCGGVPKVHTVRYRCY